jgi:hypothetical protein
MTTIRQKLAAQRYEAIRQALEQAAREEVVVYDRLVAMAVVDDRTAMQFGALAPRIQFITGLSQNIVFRALHEMHEKREVLGWRERFGKRGIIRWWPVGLWEKLQQERKAQEGGA